MLCGSGVSSPVETIGYIGPDVYFSFVPSMSFTFIRLSYSCLAVAAAASCVAGCSKSDTAQARTRDDAARSVKVEPVREESMRRMVEVVGTLAAVDEVMISSEAEGRVSRLAADLGDRVSAGQPVLELDREKPQYNFDQQ